MNATAPMRITARPLVLVADDEAPIQELIARVVTGLGLVALLVDDGAAAIAAVETHRDDFICAILDIVMPVLNGVDAAHAIQQIAPELAIVLISGAVPNHYTDRILQLRLAGRLQKPFPLRELQELILHVVENGVALERNGS